MNTLLQHTNDEGDLASLQTDFFASLVMIVSLLINVHMTTIDMDTLPDKTGSENSSWALYLNEDGSFATDTQSGSIVTMDQVLKIQRENKRPIIIYGSSRTDGVQLFKTFAELKQSKTRFSYSAVKEKSNE